MKLDRTIDRVDVYAVALATLRSFGVSGGSVAVAGHPSIRVLTKVSTDGGPRMVRGHADPRLG